MYRLYILYVAFLDASKALDKISLWTLFRKLIIFSYDFVLLHGIENKK